MKTIQFTGTDYEIENLEFSLAENDLELKSETRVYIIDSSYAIPTTDEDFMTLAEEIGRVYTLQGFQKAFNEEETISSTIDYIRIISVPLSL